MFRYRDIFKRIVLQEPYFLISRMLDYSWQNVHTLLIFKKIKGKCFGHQRPPGGWDEISKYPGSGEEIGVFYCLALNKRGR